MMRQSVPIPHDLLGELLRDILATGLCCRFRSKGHSMSPFVEDGDIVTVSPLRDACATFGRLVAFHCPRTGKLIIHRVIGTKGNQYLTKGDNASEPDCLIPKKDVLGCVWQIERNGRRIYLGLGMERLAIGFLSRMGLLCSFVRSWRWVRGKARNLSATSS
jgi:hypothetical protein